MTTAVVSYFQGGAKVWKREVCGMREVTCLYYINNLQFLFFFILVLEIPCLVTIGINQHYTFVLILFFSFLAVKKDFNIYYSREENIV